MDTTDIDTTDLDTSTTGQLPPTVRAFVAAHASRDADAALALLAPGAVIHDDGSSYAGERIERIDIVVA